MTKTPMKKSRRERLRTDDSPEKETGGTRASSRQVVTMRSVGKPDPQLLVGFIAGYMAANPGWREEASSIQQQLEPEQK